MTARAVAVLDELAEVLPLPDGTTHDDSLTEPAKSLPARRYLWPRRVARQKLEEGQDVAGVGFQRWDEADFAVRLLYTVANKGESRTQKQNRAVSVTLAELVDAVHAAVVDNRRNPLWWDLFIDNVSFDAVRTFDVRGVGFDLIVRLNIPPLGDVGS